MTDKRYAEFALWFASDRGWSSHEVELFRALRADRQRIAELEAKVTGYKLAADILKDQTQAALGRVRKIIPVLREFPNVQLHRLTGTVSLRNVIDELAAALGIRADEFTIAIK